MERSRIIVFAVITLLFLVFMFHPDGTNQNRTYVIVGMATHLVLGLVARRVLPYRVSDWRKNLMTMFRPVVIIALSIVVAIPIVDGATFGITRLTPVFEDTMVGMFLVLIATVVYIPQERKLDP